MRNNQQRLQGFTLVELIVVILLVSILSAYAASRYSGVSSVSAFAAREQAISIIRQIQLDRMQSNFPSNLSNEEIANIEAQNTLAINGSCLGSVAACEQLYSCDSDSDREKCRINVASKRSDVLYNSDISFSAYTGRRAILSLTFDLKGNPNSSSDVTITILPTGSDNSTHLCIHSQGYVAKEGC